MKNVFLLFLFITTINPVFSEQDIFSLNRDGDNLLMEGDYFSAVEKYKAVLEINP